MLGKFTPSALILILLCVNMTSASYYIQAESVSLKPLDAVVPCIMMKWPTGLVTPLTGFVFAAKTEKEGRVPITEVRAKRIQIGRSQMCSLGKGSEEAAVEVVTGGTWYGKERRGEGNKQYPHIVIVRALTLDDIHAMRAQKQSSGGFECIW